jgi:processive 1,2-diacylglycerol beta-glucosyltransferase
MPVKLFDAGTAAPLGTLTDEQFQFLADELEEESPEDADYYLDAVTVDMLEDDGAPEALIKVLRDAIGERDGIEIRWERS